MSIVIDGKPLAVLTNQGCEDTGHWTSEQFELLGLEYGEWNGKSYPLTDEEAVLISYEHLALPAVGGELMFGYTALYDGKKWLMPAIEYMKPLVRPERFKRKVERERRALHQLLSAYQGRAIYQEDGPEDRITVLLLVPIEEIQRAFGHFNAWKRFLQRSVGSSENI